MEIRVAADAAGAAEEAAAWLARQLQNAVRRRGAATLAVSGGTTPALMFADLARCDLPWAAITIWQVDERVAPDGDPARNASMLDVLPLRRGHVRLMQVTARHLDSAMRRYAASLPAQFDVVHLGMGDDGHTASWPPGDRVIDAAVPVALSSPYNGHARMTLTPTVVNSARRRLVLVTGAGKAEPMMRWILGDRSLPIQRVRRTGTVVVVDAAAAAQLPATAG